MMEITGISAVLVITLVCSFIKKDNLINSKFIPIVALLMGLPVGIFVFYPEDIFSGIFAGIVVALASVGSNSAIKNIAEGFKDNRK